MQQLSRAADCSEAVELITQNPNKPFPPSQFCGQKPASGWEPGGSTLLGGCSHQPPPPNSPPVGSIFCRNLSSTPSPVPGTARFGPWQQPSAFSHPSSSPQTKPVLSPPPRFTNHKSLGSGPPPPHINI
uniref:Uncharacterized protein n=1 Tax=Sphaerodactylus townsendi TaxID=933632 RepID=A0ACB8FVB3_9SAUR